MFGNKMSGMFGMKSSLKMNNVLNGLSRGLGIANRAIPLYQEAKPMFNNAKKALANVKNYINTKPKKEAVVNTTSKGKTMNQENDKGIRLFI